MTVKSPVWIIGASQGIGASLARHAADQGAIVAISARSEDKLKAMAQRYEPAPDSDQAGSLHAFACDVTDQASVERAYNDITDSLGPPQTVIVNAGTHHETPVDDFKAADIQKVVDLNLMGIVKVLECVMPKMVATKQGHLALVSSVAGYRGLPRAGAYCATKAAVIALAESLKIELDSRGVKIQVICPGFVRTPLTDQNAFPMPYLMEPEDAARQIWQGLQKSRFEIAFPRPFVMQLKMMAALPARLYFPLIRKATGIS